MPFSKEDVDKHKAGLTDNEKGQWVAIANSIYDKCLKDGGSDATCAVDAIKQANGSVGKESKSEPKGEGIEIRTIPDSDVEMRAINDSRRIEAIGIVFNRESQLMYEKETKRIFYERILPEAMDGVLQRSDILCLLDHKEDRGVLARSDKGNGSMQVSLLPEGVKYGFDSPNTSLGNELIESVKRGDIKGSSFSFRIPKGGDTWEKRSDGFYLRTIRQFAFIEDFSPCYKPAYQDTTVALRNLEQFIDETKETEEKIETKPVIEEPIAPPVVETKSKEPEVEIKEQRNSNNLKSNKMLTLEELKDKRAKALEENDKIYEAKTAENRAMTDKEEAQSAANNQLVKELDLQIETESRKAGKGVIIGPYLNLGKEKEPFSLMSAIRAKIEQREMPAAARDMFVHGRAAFQRAGITTAGDIILPFELRANELVAGTQYLGQEMVPEDKKPILPPLMNQLIFTQAGATYLTNLTGDVSVPSFSNATIAWKGEITTAVTADVTTAEVAFSPKRLTAFLEISKLFLIQSGPDAERMLMDILSAATARKLESTILGVANGSATQPQGMGYKFTTGDDTASASVVPTYAELVALESAVDGNNAAVDNLAYITNASGRGILKSIDKGENNDTGDMLCSETNMVNGYKLLVTNGCSGIASTDNTGDLVVFGNWKDLCICQWGGYDITVDPYTAAKTGMVVITINAYFDAKGLRGAVNTSTHAATSPDNYGISFASTAIKAS